MLELEKMIDFEVNKAKEQFGDFHSPHELAGILKEEMDEYWDSIRANDEDLYELLQVVAVGYRYLRQKAEGKEDVLKDMQALQEYRWGSHG